MAIERAPLRCTILRDVTNIELAHLGEKTSVSKSWVLGCCGRLATRTSASCQLAECLLRVPRRVRIADSVAESRQHRSDERSLAPHMEEFLVAEELFFTRFERREGPADPLPGHVDVRRMRPAWWNGSVLQEVKKVSMRFIAKFGSTCAAPAMRN